MDGLRKKIPRPTTSNRFPLNTPPALTLIDKEDLSLENPTTSFKGSKPIAKSLFAKNNKKNPPPSGAWKIIKKTIFSLFLFFILLALSAGGYFVYKINSTSNKIFSANHSAKKSPLLETIYNLADLKSDKRVSLRGESEGRINILLLGIAGKGKPGGDLTDTIMVASIDTKKNKVALLSLPRDLYASVPQSNYSAKINSLYKYGLLNDQALDPLKATIENITNLSINYYLVANFSGFEKFIDDIGGINIEVQRDIYDATYPGPNYSYETFEIKKGFHTLDGSTALKYARERHDDPEGDFGRAKRQQQVIQSAKNKLFSTKNFFNPVTINDLLNTLGENIKTDMTLDEIDSFIKLTKNLDTQNINNAVVDAWKEDSLLKVSHIFYQNSRAFILVPRIGNYSEIQDLAKNIFDLKIIEKRKISMQEENAQIALIDKTGDFKTYQKIEKLLKNKLGFEHVNKVSYDQATDSANTHILDLSSKEKPFTLDELIKKIPARLENDGAVLTPETKDELIKYDLVIILGEDLNTIYHYDEDSLDDLQKSQANQEILMMEEQ